MPEMCDFCHPWRMADGIAAAWRSGMTALPLRSIPGRATIPGRHNAAHRKSPMRLSRDPEGLSPDRPGMLRPIELNRGGYPKPERHSRSRPVRRRALRIVHHPPGGPWRSGMTALPLRSSPGRATIPGRHNAAHRKSPMRLSRDPEGLSPYRPGMLRPIELNRGGCREPGPANECTDKKRGADRSCKDKWLPGRDSNPRQGG